MAGDETGWDMYPFCWSTILPNAGAGLESVSQALAWNRNFSALSDAGSHCFGYY